MMAKPSMARRVCIPYPLSPTGGEGWGKGASGSTLTRLVPDGPSHPLPRCGRGYFPVRRSANISGDDADDAVRHDDDLLRGLAVEQPGDLRQRERGLFRFLGGGVARQVDGAAQLAVDLHR